LESLTIPEDWKKTLSGSDFLVRDSIVSDERVLMFTTSINVNYLAQSPFWICDGTFKTVPTVFRQLYTIHGRIGGDENSRIMLLVYTLMSSKSEDCYKTLFQDLLDFGE